MTTRWEQDLTRRLRTLLRTAPLHQVEAAKGHRALPLADQDLVALALRTLDVIIEAMGLDEGALHAEVALALDPLVRAADPGLEDSAPVVELVIDALTNRSQRGEVFRIPYTDFDGGFVRRELGFHLVREVESEDGRILLRATTEGINLYAGMLDYDVEDAQTAEEAVLRAQVERGRLSQAVDTARRARQRSIQYEEKLRSFLRTARRDVRGVDWVGEVLQQIDAALRHLAERLHVERDLRTQVQRRLDETEVEAPELAELASVLDDCVTRHLRLQQNLIGANQAWLDAQARQSFRPRAALPLADLERDVLRPALVLSVADLDPVVPALFASFFGPVAPRVLALDQLVSRLLAPARDAAPVDRPLATVELEPLVAPVRFDDADEQQVRDWLDAARAVRLSTLLAAARAEGAPPRTERLLALEVLRAYDGADTDGTLVVASDGERLHDPRFEGDDLWVNPGSEGP